MTHVAELVVTAIRPSKRRWLPTRLTWLTVVAAVIGLTALHYPYAASWISTLNQSAIVSHYDDAVSQARPDETQQLAAARLYNDALSSGVLLAAGANVPKGNGTTTDPEYDYNKMLTTPNGVMARLQIPKIGADLPIYHGTSEATLLQGAGHLEGTSLPIGGEGTHAVITAHRGLAEATMFTHLDQMGVGDKFTLSVFGEVLSYQVISTQVVAPEDTATLRQEPGRDLVTLITCTPLGINSHRILVTAQRVFPTPVAEVKAAAGPAEVPFPWWLVTLPAGLLLVGLYLWRAPLRAVPMVGARTGRRWRSA
ncbi:class C sortase [Psychromicrobium xiongbiense]|uniref:class C sortase n=1 Tax=Psychromicrobium xiongbiense TaxID=3051184 RepID=UPI002557C6D8|nr:class C sortase [Psychromicrobium sp. YIM S02556]